VSEHITNAEVFSEGEWNGIAISLQDLRDIARNFGLLGSAGHLPVKLGHDDAQPISGSPAVGWIEAVRVVGDKLLADFEIVSDIVAKAVRKGLYRHVSVELIRDPEVNGKQYEGYALDALALLGAEAPAVTNLEGLARLAAARAQQAIAVGARATFERKLTFAGAAEPARNDDTGLAAENARLRAQLARATTERAEFMRARTVEAAREHQRFIFTTIEDAIKAKRLLPRDRERLKHLRKLDDPTEALKFSRDDLSLYLDCHDQSPSIALVFQNTARSDKPGATMQGDPPVETLAGRARQLFAAGKAADVFVGLEMALAERPDLGQVVIDNAFGPA
jgi:hypothetical protein